MSNLPTSNIHANRRCDLRGVMSLWTKTPMFVPTRGPMLIQTLAVNLAARVFAETEFVTDKRGAEIAALLGLAVQPGLARRSKTGPPTDSRTSGRSANSSRARSRSSRSCSSTATCCSSNRCPKRLTRHRLIAQSPDFPHYYTSRDMRAAQAIAGFAPGGTAYNAGLLGGSDVALVRAYAWAGLDLAQKFRGCPLNGTTTSMIVEQYQLGVFSRRVGVEVGTLLPLAPTRKQVAKAGYAHLTGGAKREDKWIAKAEARLAADFPEAYERFLAAWPRLATGRNERTARPAIAPRRSSQRRSSAVDARADGVDLNAVFPHRAYVSLPRRQDRRAWLQARMADAGVTAEWFRAVDARRLRRWKGFAGLPQRAHSISFRLLLRAAQRRDSAALLVLEDDAVFHPEFRDRVAALELPDDWQIFYFGCQHLAPPTRVNDGLVRVKRALDTHAVAFRRSAYPRSAEDHARTARPRATNAPTCCSRSLHEKLPTYAAFPESHLAGARRVRHRPPLLQQLRRGRPAEALRGQW